MTFDPQISFAIADKQTSTTDATIELLMLALNRHSRGGDNNLKVGVPIVANCKVRGQLRLVFGKGLVSSSARSTEHCKGC